MFQVVVGGTFPLVLGKLLHMAVKAEVQSCQLFLHLPHVFELLKGAYFTWKSDRLNQTWIWWRSVSCLVITSKSKVFPWQQRRKKKKNSTACIWFQPDSCNKATFHPPLFSASNRILSGGETASYQGYLTESLQFAWVEVIEEVEEASLHLSHIWHICEEGVLQGGRLDYFTGPCWLGGPGLLPVGSDRKKNKITLQLFIFVNIWQHLKNKQNKNNTRSNQICILLYHQMQVKHSVVLVS